MPWWATALTFLVGTGGATGGVVAWRKAKPEGRAMDANTAAMVATTAGKWVLDADARMAAMQKQLDELITRTRLHDDVLVTHSRWDRAAAEALREAKINMPAAPPIYLPQTG